MPSQHCRQKNKLREQAAVHLLSLNNDTQPSTAILTTNIIENVEALLLEAQLFRTATCKQAGGTDKYKGQQPKANFMT